MNNDTIASQLMKSLSFEIEATPHTNAVQAKSSSNMPVNVKVKVRKKNDPRLQKGVISFTKPGQTGLQNERIRLASSDQTIMDFDVLMEADFEKKPIHKRRRKLFGSCLGTQSEDEDDGPYMIAPTAHITDGQYQPVVMVNEDYDGASNMIIRKPVKFLGKCKPGGCLDPPFGEDKYPYLPPNTPVPSPNDPKTKNDDKLQNVDNESGRKSDKSEFGSSIHKLYEKKNLTAPLEDTDSDTIITYPPSLSYNSNSDEKCEKAQRTSVSSKSRKSYNELPPTYFSPPRKSKDLRESDSVFKDSNETVPSTGYTQTDNYINVDLVTELNCDLEINDQNHEITKTLREPTADEVRHHKAKNLLNDKTKANINRNHNLDRKTLRSSNSKLYTLNLPVVTDTSMAQQNFGDYNKGAVDECTSPYDHKSVIPNDDNSIHGNESENSSFLFPQDIRQIRSNNISTSGSISPKSVVEISALPDYFEPTQTPIENRSHTGKLSRPSASPNSDVRNIHNLPDYVELKQKAMYGDKSPHRSVSPDSNKNNASPDNAKRINTIRDAYYDEQLARNISPTNDFSNIPTLPNYVDNKDNSLYAERLSRRSVSPDSTKKYFSPDYVKPINTTKDSSNDADKLSRRSISPNTDDRNRENIKNNLPDYVELKYDSMYYDKSSRRSRETSPESNQKYISPDYVKRINTIKGDSNDVDKPSLRSVSPNYDDRNRISSPDNVKQKYDVIPSSRSNSPDSNEKQVSRDHVKPINATQNISQYQNKPSRKSISTLSNKMYVSSDNVERTNSIEDTKNYDKPIVKKHERTSSHTSRHGTTVPNYIVNKEDPTYSNTPSHRSVSSEGNKKVTPDFFKPTDDSKYTEKPSRRSVSRNSDIIEYTSPDNVDNTNYYKTSPTSVSPTSAVTNISDVNNKDKSNITDTQSHGNISLESNIRYVSQDIMKPTNTTDNNLKYDEKSSRLHNMPDRSGIKHALADYTQSINTIKDNSMYDDKTSRRSISPKRDVRKSADSPEIKDDWMCDDEKSRKSVSPGNNKKYVSPDFAKQINTIKDNSNYEVQPSRRSGSPNSDVKNIPILLDYIESKTNSMYIDKASRRSISPNRNKNKISPPSVKQINATEDTANFDNQSQRSIIADSASRKHLSPDHAKPINTIEDDSKKTYKLSREGVIPSSRRSMRPTSDVRNSPNLLDKLKDEGSVSTYSNKKSGSPEYVQSISTSPRTVSPDSNVRNISPVSPDKPTGRSVSPNSDVKNVSYSPDYIEHQDDSKDSDKLSRRSTSPKSDKRDYASPDNIQTTSTLKDNLMNDDKPSSRSISTDSNKMAYSSDYMKSINTLPRSVSPDSNIRNISPASPDKLSRRSISPNSDGRNIPNPPNHIENHDNISKYTDKLSRRSVSLKSDKRGDTSQDYSESRNTIKDNFVYDKSLRSSVRANDEYAKSERFSRKESYICTDKSRGQSDEDIQEVKNASILYGDKPSHPNLISKRQSKASSGKNLNTKINFEHYTEDSKAQNVKTKYSDMKMSSLDYAKSVNTIQSRRSTSPNSDRKKLSLTSDGKYVYEPAQDRYNYSITSPDESIGRNEHNNTAVDVDENISDGDGIYYNTSLIQNVDVTNYHNKSISTSPSKGYKSTSSIKSSLCDVQSVGTKSTSSYKESKLSSSQGYGNIRKSKSSKNSVLKSPQHNIESDHSIIDNDEFSLPSSILSSKRNSLYEDDVSRVHGAESGSIDRYSSEKSYKHYEQQDNGSQIKNNVTADYQNVSVSLGSYKDGGNKSKQQLDYNLSLEGKNSGTFSRKLSTASSQHSPFKKLSSGAGSFKDSNELENNIDGYSASELQDERNSENTRYENSKLMADDNDNRYENIGSDHISMRGNDDTDVDSKLGRSQTKTRSGSVLSRTLSYTKKDLQSISSKMERSSLKLLPASMSFKSSHTPDKIDTVLQTQDISPKPTVSSKSSSESVQEAIAALRTNTKRSLKHSNGSISLNSSLSQSSQPLILDFAFESYTDNKKRTIKTLDSRITGAHKYSKNSLSVVRTVIKNGEEVRIPIDNKNDMVVKLKRSRIPDQDKAPIDFVKSVSFSVSGEDGGKTPIFLNEKSSKGSFDTLSMVYERQLLPLTRVMMHVKEEMDFLVKQRSILKDKLISGRVMKPRFSFSNKRCTCFKNRLWTKT